MAELTLSIDEDMASKMTPSDAQKLIRGMCITRAAMAIQCLESMITNPRINPNARVQAAIALLDRGFGRPEQNNTLIIPGAGKSGVMLVPAQSGRDSWLEQASAHHKKMLT